MAQKQRPDVEQEVSRQCPVCKNITLTAHCKNIPCGWAKCKTKTCDAVLNFARGLGHCIDQIDAPGHPRKHPVTRAALRLRLLKVGGEWVDRDEH